MRPAEGSWSAFQGRPAYGALTFAPDGGPLRRRWMNESRPGKSRSAGGRPWPRDNPASLFLVFPPGGRPWPALRDRRTDRLGRASGKAPSGAAGHPASVGAVVFTPDGKLCLPRAPTESSFSRDAATGKRLARPSSLPEKTIGDVRSIPPSAFPPKVGSSFRAGRQRRPCGRRPAARKSWSSGPGCLGQVWGGRGVRAGRAVWPSRSGGGSRDGPAVQVWVPNSGRKLYRSKNYKGLAAALAISPDGKRLALAGSPTRPPPPTRRGPRRGARRGQGAAHPQTVREAWPVLISLAYSPDGRVLAAPIKRRGRGLGCRDGRGPLAGAAGERTGTAPAAFSPDGRLLAVAIGGRSLEK